MATALITGASYGLGADFSKLLAAEKNDLVLVARSEDKLNRLKQVLEASYRIKAHVVVLDLSREKAAYELCDELNRKGLNIDILINNAGFGDFGLFADLDPVRQQQMINLNVTFLTVLTRLLLPHMLLRKQGFVLNVASTAAFQPGPLMSVYYATKAYVVSFSAALANELKGTGIRVTALCPGATATEFVSNANLAGSKLFKRMKPAHSFDVARYGIKSMKAGKTVAIHGWMNRCMACLIKFVPIGVQTMMVRKIQEKG